MKTWIDSYVCTPTIGGMVALSNSFKM